MGSRLEQRAYQRAVRSYHALPAFTVVLLVALYITAFYLTGNTVLSGVVAGIPSLFLLWRWIVVARQIDERVCPQCGQSFKKAIPWIYPPKICRHCGKSIFEDK